MSAAGCDSVVTLTLNVNQNLTGDTTATVCEGQLPFVWYEHSLTAAGTRTHTFISAAGCDSVVTLTLNVNQNLTGDTTATVCEGQLPFVWYEHSLTAAGTRTHTFISAAGCDSVVTLTLNVNQNLTGDTTATVCEGQLPFVWYEHSLTAAGTRTHTFISAAGCDSVVTLTLNVNQNLTGDTTATVCEGQLPFVWYEHSLTAAGTRTHTFISAAGCDSVVTLTLNVNQNLTGDTTATVCEGQLPFVWYEHSLTAAGTRTHTFISAAGCDSVVTLTLNVNQNLTGDTTATVCEGQLPFVWYEHSLTAAGTRTHTFISAAGCDSIVTLTLNVNQNLTGDTTATICEAQLPFVWYEHSLTAAGTRTHTFVSAAGCDSVVTLTLNVNQNLTGDTTATVCEGQLPFVWYEHSLTAAGTRTHTFISAAGCDSVVTLTLNVNQNLTGDTTATVCEGQLPFVWYEH